MKTFELTCSVCKNKFLPQKFVESLSIASNGVPQVRAECPFCRKWIKWEKYADSKLVKDILLAFYHLDLDAIKRLHDIAIIDHKEETII